VRLGRWLVVLVVLVGAALLAPRIADRLVESDGDSVPAERDRGAVIERGGGERGGERRPRTVKTARCPAGVAECAETEGEILYVEAVDPDGDGDAHFVVLDGQSISLPGLTAIDVRKGLRADPLPGPGDLVSAAGPVQTGSFGQSQIHALEFNVAR
jgi:hypothetical protein